MAEKELLAKRRRGRPKKITSSDAAQIQKNKLPNQWEDDFIFPIFKQLETKISVHQETPSSKFVKPSPHVLDLKNDKKENWENDHFSALNENYSATDWAKHLASFTPHIEAPSDTEQKTSAKKIFHRPEKIKKPYYTKMNLSKGVVDHSVDKSTLWPWLNQLLLWRLLKTFLVIFWKIITFPFRALDFLVDLILKSVWFLIHLFFSGLKYLCLSFVKNLKQIFSSPFSILPHKKILSPASGLTFRFKSIFVFVLVAILIVVPLQIINWQKKSQVLKSVVLGQSISGLNSLKQAVNWSNLGEFNKADQEFNNAYFNFNEAKNKIDQLNIFTEQIIKIVPEAREGDNLLRLGQLTALLGKKLTSAVTFSAAATEETPAFANKFIALNKTTTEIEPLIKEINGHLNNINFDVLKKYLSNEEINQLTTYQKTLAVLTTNLNNLKTLSNFFISFLGVDQPKQYLFIFQNNAEMRPTGGFMGSFALIEIKQGKIVKLEIPGGGFYDLKAATQTIVEAPKPIQRFSPFWQIWDANWFPDWSASAQKISWFYEKMLNGTTVDGIIAITPDVLIDLLKITGPIEMPAYQKTITAENFMYEVQMAVELEYDKTENQPKKIIADMMPEILNRVFHLPASQVAPWLQTLLNNANQKNILFWFRDEPMQATTKTLGLDGEIKQTPNDYLMVVHTNIGGGKTDRVIKNKIDYQINVNDQGELIATINLTRQHAGDLNNVFENQTNVDFVRFYVPLGSELLTASNFDVMSPNLFQTNTDLPINKDPHLLALEKNPLIDELSGTRITEEFDKTVFGNWVVLKPSQEKTVSLSYRLPFTFTTTQPNAWEKIKNFFHAAAISTDFNYQLLIQKQPGQLNTEITSSFTAPKNWSLTNNSSAPVEISGSTASFKGKLEQDTVYGLNIRSALQ
ncbi:MAG TPA: DUF4012 domain-containing protein [bacterium]|nr:DUF4012 domain-containing protein [bacterium]